MKMISTVIMFAAMLVACERVPDEIGALPQLEGSRIVSAKRNALGGTEALISVPGSVEHVIGPYLKTLTREGWLLRSQSEDYIGVYKEGGPGMTVDFSQAGPDVHLEIYMGAGR